MDTPVQQAHSPIPQLHLAAAGTTDIAVADLQKTLRTLHHFHLGNPDAGEHVEPVAEDFLPALLHPFRDASKVRHDYPLVLFAADQTNVAAAESKLAQPLTDFLQESVEQFAPAENSAKILKDHLSWLEHNIRQDLLPQEAMVPLYQALEQAAIALQEHLKLAESNRETLQNDIDQLLALPNIIHPENKLLGYSRYSAVLLMIHVTRVQAKNRWTDFSNEVVDLRNALTNLLNVEASKSVETLQPEALEKQVGSATSDRFNADALSQILKQSQSRSGTIQMPFERKIRIEQALETLNSFDTDQTQVYFVYTGDFSANWLPDESIQFSAIENEDPCHQAMVIFEQQAKQLAELIAACRIAKLETENRYDPTIHDPWFDHFNWEAFSEEELLLSPSILVLEPAYRIATTGMYSFSRLLNSSYPVQILARVQAHGNPGEGFRQPARREASLMTGEVREIAAESDHPFQEYRTELGHIAMGHRQAYVSQTSTARYEHLLQGFVEATRIPRTSLHLINTGIQEDAKFTMAPWLVSNAALEARAHPLFHVNPERGDTYAQRLDFSENPQSGEDWVQHPFQYQNANGETVAQELTFTFADYALLVPKIRHHFCIVPAELNDDTSLVSVADFLRLPKEEQMRTIPFIWAVNSNNELRKLIVSREIILGSTDRLHAWHTLQELAGVRNPHVARAVASTTEQLMERHEAEKQQLIAQHQQELAELQSVATENAMGNLANLLMGLGDADGWSVPAGKATPAAATTQAATSETPKADSASETAETAAEEAVTETAEEPAAPETPIMADPWIDSEYCSTCNDCTEMNGQMFVYNDDKQAYIADPNAGTYAELVEAAEICPTSCIHPGLPLNPNEPNLEELIERAKPFNE